MTTNKRLLISLLSLFNLSTIQTLTVGTGFTPDQSPKHCRGESRTFTAGRELRPAPKD